MSLRWSDSDGSASSRYLFCTAGRKMTCLPTPTVAALGLVDSGGTMTSRSELAAARQASRQPARSSSGEKARASTLDGGTAPPVICTLHFLQVPCPPQVESIAMPFQLAASNTLTPAGTRTRVPFGKKTRSTLSARGDASARGDDPPLCPPGGLPPEPPAPAYRGASG